MLVPEDLPPWAPAAEATGNDQRGYYRFPTLHGARIVFASDDDLWSVPAEGGVARRLTAGRGTASRALFSPDGTTLAFAANEEGGPEIYLMPAEGGEPRRLTFLGSQIFPVAWSRDGREILCASDWQQPFGGDHHLIAVAVISGRARPLNIGPARALAFQPQGPGVVIARHGGDPARWKRYRGGTAGTLWLDRRGDGEFRQILKSVKGNLASPMWIGERIYFLSDHEGIGNLYSVRADGRGAIVRHSDHADFYARFPSTDGKRIVYHAGADLHLLDPASGPPRRLPVSIPSARPQRRRKFVNGGALEDFDAHPAGHSILLTVRGRPIAMGLWEGPATEFGTPWRGRHRLARWLNDGKRLLAVSDETGEEQLKIFTPGEGETLFPASQNLGRLIDLEVAPAPPRDEESRKGRKGKKRLSQRSRRSMHAGQEESEPAPDIIAFTNQRQEVCIADLTQGTVRCVDRSEYDRIAGIAWSPDGRWLAYGIATGRRQKVIRVVEAATGEIHAITSGDFLDFSPCFDPEGRYLHFLSLRSYDPVYDLIQFGLGFPRGVRPCLVTLHAEEGSPFLPAPRPLGSSKNASSMARNPWEIGPANAPDKTAREKEPKKERRDTKKIKIDFDGIAGRVLALPVGEGRYRDIAAAPGRVLLLADSIEGSLGQNWMPGSAAGRSSIEVYDLRELKSGTLAGGVSAFRMSRDGKTLVYQAGGRLRALLASSEPGKLSSDDKPGRASGWLDLGRVRCSIEPVQEWRQMLAEIWRLQRDQFWVPDMSRVDWKGVYARYLPLVERVSTRGEFSDLVWEMQGELGTSHAYEIGGDYRLPPAYAQGFLGADLAYDERARAWVIARLPAGDSWDAKQASPLSAPGIEIRPGTRIYEVNGLPVGPERSPMECLVHRAGQEVWLTISAPQPARRRSSKSKARKKQAPGPSPEKRSITLRTLFSEGPLRYRDWVASRRARVHRESGGRVGYVHIPNMGPSGYAEFHRYFLAEIDRPGLIIDLRRNTGGHVSQLLFDKLLRRRVGFDYSRYGGLSPYPSEAPRGPMVALTDELAGSDGDVFSHVWKLHKLGPLIGKRTWGGVIGIWPRQLLVDGTVTTQPEFSSWFQEAGWGVENYGVDPDIEVDFRPQDYAAGTDPQLDRALREALRLVERAREPLPDLKLRPNLGWPALPSPAQARPPAGRRPSSSKQARSRRLRRRKT